MRRIDRPLLVLTLVLAAAGLLMVGSASFVVSQENFGTPYYYFWHQGLSALLGLGALAVTQAVPYRLWRKFALPLLALALVLAAAVFMPQLGFRAGGAARWLNLGPFSFQPSEILKFSLIIYLASWLDRKKGQSKGLTSAFIPFLVIIGLAGILLALQPDIGTLVVLAGSAVALYFLGGGRTSQILAFGLLSALALFILVELAPYRVARFLVFLNPNLDPQGVGYHISQALIAIGSGGFAGRGFGQSIQKHSYLPEPFGDSIFAVIVEELGFVGGLALLALYLGWFLRAAAIARGTPDFFGKLLVTGFAALIALQAAINLAAISGLLPLTGVPLPLVSYGGTSLIATMAMVGIMLNVSKHT